MNDSRPDALLTRLPAHLAERCRVMKGGAAADGGFVLYWMHHAVRGNENPALEVAIESANRLGLPVLVYQGLGGAHRYNSDRHHSFILQGARDAHREIAGRGIRAVFHLPTDLTRPSPLPGLAARAALVVVEDYPAPPFPAWTPAGAGSGLAVQQSRRPPIAASWSPGTTATRAPGFGIDFFLGDGSLLERFGRLWHRHIVPEPDQCRQAVAGPLGIHHVLAR